MEKTIERAEHHRDNNQQHDVCLSEDHGDGRATYGQHTTAERALTYASAEKTTEIAERHRDGTTPVAAPATGLRGRSLPQMMAKLCRFPRLCQNQLELTINTN